MNNQNDTKQCLDSNYTDSINNDLPQVNQALLDGATSLMQNIYSFDNDESQYCPNGYTQNSDTTKQTKYVIHSQCYSSVYWGDDIYLIWESRPENNFKGNIEQAGLAEKEKPNSSCFTDCSGFITALFTYVNFGPSKVTTKFIGWKSGFVVPEAGCFIDQTELNNYTNPNPINFYNMIKHKDGFDEISVQNLKPGDLIVKANAKDHKDTGHIMLVTSILQNTNNKDEYWVIVIDETADPHSCDTRSNIDSNSIGGIGMGIVKLCAVNGGVNFYWSICSNKVDADASVVVLGRALKQ